MVYFVGAGSGAVDLITVRGLKLIREADLIIYAGSLVNPELLSERKEDCLVYNSAEMHLQEIADLMVTAHFEGKQVVRLHTGDPSIYGAIREQMDILESKGVSYEVCPGVSSFCSAAASLKSEYTLPGVSQTVIITRMEGRTGVPEKESIAALAEHHATMVIFLSASMTAAVKEALLEGGYSENTPCAIVFKASWPDEKVVRGTVSELAEMASRNRISKTALILVGDFLEGQYELSKLYDRKFTTEFRKGSDE